MAGPRLPDERDPNGLRRSLRALDWLSFFLADVQSGLGPFLAVYLMTVPGWNAQSIGLVMSVTAAATLVAQTPAGAAIDHTHRKRAWVVTAAALVSISAVTVTLAPTLPVVTATQIVGGMAAAVFAPALAALALGLVGPERFTYRMGRIQAFNHAGNVAAAVVAGAAGYLIGLGAVFWLIGLLGIGAIVAACRIHPCLIDHDLARGFRSHAEVGRRPSAWKPLLESRPLLIFLMSILLFHLAGAAMLPVMGERLVLGGIGESALFMSGLIVIAQAVMVPMSILVGRHADTWGRKPLFLAAFIALPVRALLFTLSDNTVYLLSVQILDGVSAGIFDALFPLVIADLTLGTGHYNTTLGAATTIKGVGAALSTTLAGAVIVSAGYRTAFLVLAAIAVLALLLFVVGVPETAPGRVRRRLPTADLADSRVTRSCRSGMGRRGYPPEFRRQMVELLRAGRTPADLAKEFEPTALSIRNWMA